jgi:hypothetical protein
MDSKEKFKIFLLFLLGLFIGFFFHAYFETIIIWVLLNFFKNFFLKTPFNLWLLIHLIYSILMEVFGVIFVFWLYKKLWK